MRSLAVFFAVLMASNTTHAGAIHDAAKKGDVAGIEAALATGTEVNAPEEKGLKATALYYSTSKGHIEAIQLLIARGADVNRESDLVEPPIIIAAAYGRSDILQLLLTHSANPNRSFKGNTALHEAARVGCLDCVKMLVEAGADVNAVNAMREPPIHLALFNRHQEIADYLADHGYVKPIIPSISGVLSLADPAAGQNLYNHYCGCCHDRTAAEAIKNGPPLWDVVGRPRAAMPHATFSYSKAMQAQGGVWGFEELNRFLAEPSRSIPGTSMKARSFQAVQDRANLIVYLRTLSDNPVPLPQ